MACKQESIANSSQGQSVSWTDALKILCFLLLPALPVLMPVPCKDSAPRSISCCKAKSHLEGISLCLFGSLETIAQTSWRIGVHVAETSQPERLQASCSKQHHGSSLRVRSGDPAVSTSQLKLLPMPGFAHCFGFFGHSRVISSCSCYRQFISMVHGRRLSNRAAPAMYLLPDMNCHVAGC